MTTDTLRKTLMQGTRDLHEQLDRGIGALQSEGEYRRFLIGSHAFRAALEPALMPACGWQAVELAPTLRADLADLGLTAAPAPAAPRLDGVAAQAGALYVVEGSALGARLLYRRAQALGWARRGARGISRHRPASPGAGAAFSNGSKPAVPIRRRPWLRRTRSLRWRFAPMGSRRQHDLQPGLGCLFGGSPD